jgi:hypothetical protein
MALEMRLGLQKYLKKFENVVSRDSQIKNAVIQAVYEACKSTLAKNQISISGKKVFISAPSVLKSEIAIKQHRILEKIKELIPSVSIDKIL